MLPRDVEQIVAHEHARETDVGAKAAQLDVHLVVVRVELIELRVDLLGLARGREHRQRDEQQEAAEPERRNEPRSEAHDEPPGPRSSVPRGRSGRTSPRQGRPRAVELAGNGGGAPQSIGRA